MKNENPAPPATPPSAKKVSVRIFGIGKAGSAMLESMLQGEFAGAHFVAVDTDAQALSASSAPEKVCLDSKPLRGLGTGGDPERGHALAEEHFPQLKALCAGAEMVFLLAGLGGGAGTGISPVLARAAKEAGALVLGFVTLPFDCEGNRRQRVGRQGLDQLKAAADGVVCLPDQKLFQLMDENTGVGEAFRTATQQLTEGARGVWRLLTHTGLIQIHFSELCGLLRDRHGESCFAAIEATGAKRAGAAVEKLLAHPMLDGGECLADADAVLVSVMGGPDLTMADVNRVMEGLQAHCPQAQVILGAAVDDTFRDRLGVIVIAANHGGREHVKTESDEGVVFDGEGGRAPDFDSELLHRRPTRRPASRIVPPAPSLTPEQREQFLARQTPAAGRGRKTVSRLRQGTLPLDIVNKGRFDKTEPTVHKGEDLDVPTYIRRGVALN